MALLLRSAEIKPWFIRFVPLEHFSLPCQGFIWVSVFIVPRDLPEICTSPQNPCHEHISKTAQSVAIIVSFMSLLISIYLPEIYLGLGFYSALGLCFGTARACMCMCKSLIEDPLEGKSGASSRGNSSSNSVY